MEICPPCQAYEDQIASFSNAIAAIRSSPGYIQGPDDPNPGKPDPEMLAEVQQLRKKIDKLKSQLNDCIATNCGGVPWIQLPVVLQFQAQLNWCWAAVTSMISHFYDGAAGFSQCQVATPTINQWRMAQPTSLATADCCTPPVASSNLCNVTWGLVPPLYLTGHFGSMSGGVATFSVVRAQLIAGFPVCFQIAWVGGGGHFAIIDGAQEAGQLLHVDDPAFGAGVYPYTTVRDNYQGTGAWVNTFLTTT